MSRTTTGDTPEELRDLALEIAREAGELVMARQRDGVEVAATKSSVTDPVTEADRACEELIRLRLAQARPDDAVLGEEGDDQPGTSGVRWVVDPIDGTVNFLYGLPEHAVSIAAEVGSTVVAGVVRNSATGTEYVAHVAADGTVVSRRDGAPVAVRDTVALAERLCATGFSYDPVLREAQARAWVRLLPRVRDLRRHGSCALELCHLAEGALDAYFEEAVNLWDYAAGALVARGAGARVEELVGSSGRTLLLAAPTDGFDELHEAVVAAGFTRLEPV